MKVATEWPPKQEALTTEYKRGECLQSLGEWPYFRVDLYAWQWMTRD